MIRKHYLLTLSVIFSCLAIVIAEQIVNQLTPPKYAFWIIGTPEHQGTTEEIIVLQINSNEDAFTTQKFSGSVTITIRGEGRINEEILHDAFYVYFVDEQNPVRFEGFKIDGKDTLFPVFAGIPPKYTQDHEYSFLYHIGDEPRYIGFRMLNDSTEDTSDTFAVEVSIYNKVTGTGR